MRFALAAALGHDLVDDLEDVVLGRNALAFVLDGILRPTAEEQLDPLPLHADGVDQPAGELLGVVDGRLERGLVPAVVVDADDDRPAQA
jgi:hypothetical protein